MVNRVKANASAPWLGLVLALSLLLIGSFATVQAADSFWDLILGGGSSSSSQTPTTPTTPQSGSSSSQSDIIKDVQALFNEQANTGQSTSSTSRGMTVQGVTVEPTPLSIWTDRTSYYSGDQVRISFTLPRTAYVYILNVDVQGVIRLIFPNTYDTNAWMNSGTYTLPRNNKYVYPVSGANGTEYLMIIASSDRISYFDTLSDRGGGFPVAGSPSQLLSELQKWIKQNTSWSAFGWAQFRLENRILTPIPPKNVPPVARISASESKVIVGSSITFSGRDSFDQDGSIRYYRWDVNNDGRTDGTSDTIRWTFASAGTFTVRLTVEDNQGATATTTVQVVVEEPRTLLEVKVNRNLSIYLDGVYIGRSSVKQSVLPGMHTIKITDTSGAVFNNVITIPVGMKEFTLDVKF
jgi:PKD repeat protein